MHFSLTLKETLQAGKNSSISVCISMIVTKPEKEVEMWDSKAKTERDGL